MRLSDFAFAFPALLSAIMLTAIYGPGLVTSIVAIGIFNIPVFARITRLGAARVWSREFVLAARACGKGAWRITIEHVLPNIASLLIVQATIQFAIAILAEAALSYLGLGTQPPMPSWGRMLNEAQRMMFQAPMLAIWPGLAIVVHGARPEPDGRRPARPARPEARKEAMTMKIEFVSDVACPWCAVGLASLERALDRIGDAIPVELRFEPYELNPTMRPEGADANEYLRAKYGLGPEQLAKNRAAIKAARRRGRLRVRRAARTSGTPSTRTACCTGPGSKAASTSSSARCCGPTTAKAAAWATMPCCWRSPAKSASTSSAPARCWRAANSPTRCGSANAIGRSSASRPCRR